jgi:hypothetical protein
MSIEPELPPEVRKLMDRQNVSKQADLMPSLVIVSG